MIARHPRRRGQRGAMVIVVAQMALAIVFFMLAGLVIGRLAIQRDEQQNAVDAINLARVQVVKKEGLAAVCDPVKRRQIEDALIFDNMRYHGWVTDDPVIDCEPPTFLDEDGDGVGQLRFNTQLRSEFDNPFDWRADPGNDRATLDPGVDSLRGKIVTEIVQSKMNEVELPKVVFALDYSGSMNGNYAGGESKVVVLRRVVNSLLDLNLPVEFGLVQFSEGVFNTIPVEFDENQDVIRDAITRGPGGLTNYQAAFDSSSNVLRNRGAEKGYVVFMADGLPTAGGDSRDAARRVWNRGYTILSIFIGDAGGGRDLLIDVSGSRDNPSNPDFMFEARDPDALVDAIEEVFRTILCSIGPIEPAPDPDADLGLFIELDNGDEVTVRQVLNPQQLDSLDEDLALYNPADHFVKLSEGACNRILFDGAKLVARHGSPILHE